MSIRIVRLGTARHKAEGLRIGTVRRPPRGVRKERFAAEDWFDLWYPELSPSDALVKEALLAETAAVWRGFERRVRREMNAPAAARTLEETLARLSHQTNFSVGCYCEDEARCHRSILRALLAEQGADIADKS